MSEVRRVFVEKKEGFDVAATSLLQDLRENLLLDQLSGLRLINRYDISGVSDVEYQQAVSAVFSEPNVDYVYHEMIPTHEGAHEFAVAYLPGQYDQRSDSAAQCIQIFTQKEKPEVLHATVYILYGSLSPQEIQKIKEYVINPVDSHEVTLDKPLTLEQQSETPADVAIIKGFIEMSEQELASYAEETGFAMNIEDVLFCQEYFKNKEKRNPTITELKLIDTYWSDHCRHTTFLTEIEEVSIEDGPFAAIIKEAHQVYLDQRDYVYGKDKKDLCLMDLAVIGMKELRKKGKLEDLDASEEVNACSITIQVDVDGQMQEYLLMFKNETHNHPTEIEPFGGAATCLGGAIRDPLSGRSYVYQAMRVTGAADPRKPVSETLAGKLPQRKITTEAAHGYSSYGNQIGLATGQVAEVYDEDFVAKRMEVGAVIAAAPKENVVREKPEPGDLIILVGGRTGRDGCGGATGSSKEHDEESIFSCGAEVQKGNPPTERKIQRLFRDPLVSKMIKRCNDFGAGGVSVAIGELTDSLEVDLDCIPKKYEGLDGTELAISESQERMAVVVDQKDAEQFIALAEKENVEATVVAVVTDNHRLIMRWRGKKIVDLDRAFLDTNGIKQKTKVLVTTVNDKENYFTKIPDAINHAKNFTEAWMENLKDLNVASQKGLTEMFDSTIGAGTVLMPLGGKTQMTPAEAMVCKIPLLEGQTKTASIMSYGYHPAIGKWSPFHGALYAVLESVAKIVACGGDYKTIRLSLQEYFEKLGDLPEKWGKPYAAILGANYLMHQLEIPAIGGKDSMSGSFKDLHVPPTLVSFAVSTLHSDQVVSPEFKRAGNKVVCLPLQRDKQEIPDIEQLKKNYEFVNQRMAEGRILSCQSIRHGGIAAAISKMCFGNEIGMKFIGGISHETLFLPDYGSLIIEIEEKDLNREFFGELDYVVLGQTSDLPVIILNGEEISLSDAKKAWEEPLEKIFPVQKKTDGPLKKVFYDKGPVISRSVAIARPKVMIPVFPGTNCEYDTAKAFNEAGGQAEMMIFRNLKPQDIEESVNQMAKLINESQIIALPGGFSAGDEPDGSGKFIATVFRNPKIKEAVMELLTKRDGLILGICNGFQALIKLGLVPYGEIRDIQEDSPTLTFNSIGRHISCLSNTKIVSNLSPWLNGYQPGDVATVAFSHGEGRFSAGTKEIDMMIANGQIASQYVDEKGHPTYDIAWNPNGSVLAVEGITSPDGRILGKMGHNERMQDQVAINVPGHRDLRIFKAGINYYK